MKSYFIVFILLVTGTCTSLHADETKAFNRLTKATPTVAWPKKAIEIDIDCDGKKDYVFSAQTEKSVSVGVVLGNSKRKPESFTFDVNRDRQDAVCALPVRIEPEAQDFDPTEDIGEIPGFVRSKTCHAFALVNEECDSFHFYWNHSTKLIEWWRL
ncbi:MAG: hypothetical protein K8Q92_05830 [Methylophilales bacterium]|nr:hypothetical protein [Methylophilales bacterium]